MHKDYLMRQIEYITTAVAELIFHKPSSRYEAQSEVRQIESDLLYVLLCSMVNDKSINGAEDLLFDMLDADNHEHLLIATDFYNQLSSMTDEDLIKADFTRDEIERGLREVNAIFGLSIKNTDCVSYACPKLNK